MWPRFRLPVLRQPRCRGSPADIYHLLRPLLKQTIVYVHLRGRDVVTHGSGPVERIVIDRADVSTYFTPLSICLNVDLFEYLEFETGPMRW